MKQIKCPICNQRLFDASEGNAKIDIKCVRCGKIVQIQLAETAGLKKVI